MLLVGIEHFVIPERIFLIVKNRLVRSSITHILGICKCNVLSEHEIDIKLSRFLVLTTLWNTD